MHKLTTLALAIGVAAVGASAQEAAPTAEQTPPVAAEQTAAPAQEAAPAEDTDHAQVANAAGSAIDAIKASMSEGTSAAQKMVTFSGVTKVKAYTSDLFDDDDVTHAYRSTLDLNVNVQFNEKWSAVVQLEADGWSETPSAYYNGAYIMYKPFDIFDVKIGDLTWGEGAFKTYYDYDDPGDFAVGLKNHDVRGLQIDLAGLELGIGFGRKDNDKRPTYDWDEKNGLKNDTEKGNNYEVHAAYDFNYAGQHLRPYFDYKSFQQKKHNELHAGVDAGLNIGGFDFRAVYGFHSDYISDDGDVFDEIDMTSTAHAFLVEPTFKLGMFEIKTAAFYAIVNENDLDMIEGDDVNNVLVAWPVIRESRNGDLPEYFFAYAEPAFQPAAFIKLGIPVEYHTNTLNKDLDFQSFAAGGRLYITPVENLNLLASGMFTKPLGDDLKDAISGDVMFNLRGEIAYTF